MDVNNIITMLNLILLFQIPIFLLLIIGSYYDNKSRTVSNKIVFPIIIFLIPIIVIKKVDLLIPIILSFIILALFYYTDQIGGADTKVLVPLFLQMSSNDIFVFFLFFTIPNIYFLLKSTRAIPLFISILFGYLGIIILSLLPIIIKIIFSE